MAVGIGVHEFQDIMIWEGIEKDNLISGSFMGGSQSCFSVDASLRSYRNCYWKVSWDMYDGFLPLAVMVEYIIASPYPVMTKCWFFVRLKGLWWRSTQCAHQREREARRKCFVLSMLHNAISQRSLLVWKEKLLRMQFCLKMRSRLTRTSCVS